MFVIEDERHAEPQGQFASFEQALAELKQRATIPWHEHPNVAPCANWCNCGRAYEIIEYDNSRFSWTELRRVAVLNVSEAGVEWAERFRNAGEDP